MHAKSSGRVGAASIVGCVVVGCAASAGQVRASRPHARVLVRIEHGGHDDEYLDSLNLDGLHYGLVSGDPMLLRLAPGKHELQLVSRRFDYRMQLVSTPGWGESCATMSCIDRGAPSEDRLELAPESVADCFETVVLEVKAGESHEAVLSANPDGTCRTRG